jgi:alpha-galactosidase
MGWSSWYTAHTDVSDALMRAQADALLSTGLADHGYSYINIDDGWNRNSKSTDPAVNGPAGDDNGNLRTTANFPDIKGLSDYLHAKG